MTLECWDKAEQALAAEEHGYQASRIADMLENAGIAVHGPEGRALQEVLWSTGTPKSSRVHLFLALNSMTPEQIAESGLDRFVALRDALFRKSAKQPDLVNYVWWGTRALPSQAFSLVRERKDDLLAFLGSQQIEANVSGIEYQREQVMLPEEALSLVAGIPHGIWDLRRRISVGLNHFDDMIAGDWNRWALTLKRDFIAMVEVDALSLDAHPYLDAFPRALKCSDWRDALASELSQRDRFSWAYPMIEGIWELALERFKRSAA